MICLIYLSLLRNCFMVPAAPALVTAAEWLSCCSLWRPLLHTSASHRSRVHWWTRQLTTSRRHQTRGNFNSTVLFSSYTSGHMYIVLEVTGGPGNCHCSNESQVYVYTDIYFLVSTTPLTHSGLKLENRNSVNWRQSSASCQQPKVMIVRLWPVICHMWWWLILPTAAAPRRGPHWFSQLCNIATYVDRGGGCCWQQGLSENNTHDWLLNMLM